MGRERVGEEQTDTELVLAARNDDPAAFGQLFDRWFNRTWNVARTILRDDDLAADVAQDAMVKAWQQLDQLQDPDAFGGWLLRSTRNRALNRLAREGRSRASGDDVVSGLRDRGADDPVGAERLPEPDLVNEIRDRQELVWAAATALGERDASLLDLHLRHGLTPAEIAEELGVEANAAHQQLFRLRNRLGDAIGSYLLWRNGRPLCDGLAEAVSGRTAFDRSVAKSVARHQSSCEHCSEERESLVDPSKLFAAVPLLLVPPHLKAEAAAALQSVGVPTDSSGSGSEGSGPEGSGSESSGSGPDSSGSESSADVSASSTDGSEPSGSEPSGSDGGSSSGPGGGESTVVDPGTGGASAGPSPDGIRLDFGSNAGPSPTPANAGAGSGSGSGFALANEAVGAGPGPAVLAPVKAVSRARAMALAGAGVVAVAALIGLGAFVLRDGGASDNVAAIASIDGDDPNPPAGDQGAAGDEGDPAGPASFAPSSDSSTPSEPTSAAADDPTTTRESTTRPETSRPETTRESTTDTTVTPDPDPDPDPDPTPSVTPTVSRPDPNPDPDPDPDPDPTPSVTVPDPDPDPDPNPDPDPDPDPDPSVTVTVTVTVPDPDPVDPPLIIRFSATTPRGPLLCQDRNQRPFQASWFTENTDSVVLSLPNSSRTDGPSGSYQFCGSTGDVIVLEAIGPGGSVRDRRVLG